jgi:hypothetical protein
MKNAKTPQSSGRPVIFIDCLIPELTDRRERPDGG